MKILYFDVIILGNTISGIFAEKYLKERLGNSIDVFLLDHNILSKINEKQSDNKVQLNGFCCQDGLNTLENYSFIKKFGYILNLPLKANNDKSNSMCECKNSRIDSIFNLYTKKDNTCSIESIFTRIELNQWLSQLDDLENYGNIKESKIQQLDSISVMKNLKDYILTSYGRKIASELVQEECGMDPSEISLLHYIQMRNSKKIELRGYKNDGKYIAAEIISIEKTKHGIILKTQSRDIEYRCTTLMMALPAYKVKEIYIDSNLISDEERMVISSMHHHLMKKVTVSYAKCFWHNNNCKAEMELNGPLWNIKVGSTLKKSEDSDNWVYDFQQPYITGYYRINYNEDGDEKYIQEKIIEQLMRIFGEDSKNFIQYTEEWVMSSDIPKFGHFHDLLKMMNSNSDLEKIEWSALDLYNECDLESSLRAGYLSAFKIMYALRPQAIGIDDISMIYPPKVLREFSVPRFIQSINLKMLAEICMLISSAFFVMKIVKLIKGSLN